MKRISIGIIPVTVAALLLLTVPSQAAPIWTAFNDLGGSLSTGNVTNFSGPTADNAFGTGFNRLGVAQGAFTSTGTLLKISDGSSTGVTLSVSGTTNRWNLTGSNVGPSGGDALTFFGGVPGLDTQGISDTNSAGADFIQLDFTGLNPLATYSFTLFSNRGTGGPSGTTTPTSRWLRGQVRDLQSFTNSSTVSAKTVKQTQLMTNDTTGIEMGHLQVTGEVIRYTNIQAGADGDFTIFIDSPNTGDPAFLPPYNATVNWTQINALRLDLDSIQEVPEPGTFAVGAMGLLLVGAMLCRPRTRRHRPG